MANGGPILGLDPSSSCIGYGSLTTARQFVQAGIILPDHPADGSFKRIVSMQRDLTGLLDRLAPSRILIEWTKGKVGHRHGGFGAGLAVYGCGVGAAAVTAMAWAQSRDTPVEAILENDWTRGVPKSARQLAIAKLYSEYAPHLADDPGGDMADGLGLVHWWLTERWAKEACLWI